MEYTAVSLPKKLMKLVDDYIKSNPEMAYTSQAEFVKCAIREKIIRCLNVEV